MRANVNFKHQCPIAGCCLPCEKGEKYCPKCLKEQLIIDKEYTHPTCFHSCSSNCRRNGCNCECGEFHGKLTLEEYQEAVSDLNAELAGAEVDSY